jgi:hypothetical protein
MRTGLGLAAGMAVLALVFGTSGSAGPRQSSPVAAAPTTTVSTARVRPGLTDVRPGLISTIQALSTSECTQLGGAVVDEDVRLCDSGSVCVKADQHGTVHRVCISKAQ